MQSQNNEFFSKLFQLINDTDSINLAVGQPNIKPPTNVIQELKKNVNSYMLYTDSCGIVELRNQIKNKLRNENKINTEEIIVTNGAVEAIFDTMIAYLKKNSDIILFAPFYQKYESISKIIGAKIIKIPLTGYNRPNLNRFRTVVNKKTKMIIINSPNNPTGIVYSEDEIKEIIEIAKKHKTLILSDEVYEKFIYNGKNHISPASYYENVITINSFSKTFSIPGLRLGFLAGKSELVNQIKNIHRSVTTCSSFAAQKACALGLTNSKKFMDISLFDKKRKFVMNKLDEAGIKYIYPEGTFYCYIFTNKNSLKIAESLMKKKVLVMPSSLYGDGNNAVRISFAIDKSKLRRGLEQIITEIKT